MGIGKNIRNRRKALKLTLNQVAEAIDWDNGNLSRLEREVQGTTEDRLEKIATALNTTIAELYAYNESNIEEGPNLKGKVPLISWVQAGDYVEAIDLFQPGDAEEWVETTVNIRKHTFAVRVVGDSMEGEFPAGTILVVEPDMNAEPGQFVVVRNGDNEATFKQLVKDGSDFYLKPLNARYPIKPLGDSQILGVVREAIRRLA